MKKEIHPSALASPMMVEMIGTYDEKSVPNLMNAAWGGQLTNDLFLLSLSKPHKTVANILARKAFTIGFPRAIDAVDCDYVGMVSGNDVPDKVANTKLTPRKSSVDAPYFEEFPLTYVCTLEQVVDDPVYGFYVIGKVQSILVDEEADLGKGKFDVAKMDPILFTALDGTYRRFGEVVGRAFDIGKQRKKG